MEEQDLHTWLFRHAPILATAIDKNGIFLDVSAAFAKRLGYAREELVGLGPDDLATPESLQQIQKEYLPLVRRTGALENVPIEFQTRKGDKLALIGSLCTELDDDEAFRAVAIYKESGEITKILHQITNLYQSTPAMLYVMDADNRLLDVSDRLLRKLGYLRDEVLGRNARDLLFSQHTRDQLIKGRLRQLVDVGDHTNLPRQMVKKNGDIVDVLVSATIQRDEAGDMHRMMVACKDVTIANRAERKLRDACDENARLRHELESERDYLRENVEISMNFGQIIGSSPALQKLMGQIEAVATTSASALIVGESGTGKELVAHAIHGASERSDKPLVKVNCASIPDELFESEFFGHKKGAFTGAHQNRVGRFKLADGGTLFLDEIGEIPLTLQGKLLRVLQEQEFEAVGDDRTVSVNVRVIAATNRDLMAEVAAGRFREDLYYRISVFPLEVPALRERAEDVIQLATNFLNQMATEFGRPGIVLSQAQIDTLCAYDWPGNVRELRNVLERAVILSKGETIRLDLKPKRIPETSVVLPPKEGDLQKRGFLTEKEFRERERANIIAALEHANWRVSGKQGAAQSLGIKPTTLNGRMRAFGIARERLQRGRPKESTQH